MIDTTKTRQRRISRSHSRTYAQVLGRHAKKFEESNYRSSEGRKTLNRVQSVLYEIQEWSRRFRDTGKRFRIRAGKRWAGEIYESRKMERAIQQSPRGERRTVEIAGIVNNSRFHFHYFYDFDNVDYPSVLFAAMYLTIENNCDMIIRESSKGAYHLICPNPMTKEEVIRMQRNTPQTNQTYFHLDEILETDRLGSGNTLRISGKGGKLQPTTICQIWFGERTVCKAYLEVFNLSPPDLRMVALAHCTPTFSIYQSQEVTH